MTQIPTSSISEKSFSDRVIDGLFGGLMAGLAMILVMVLTSLVFKQDPALMLASFSVGEVATPLNGMLVHLGVSGVYGAIFSILMSILPRAVRRMAPGWFAGLLYGALLLSIAIGLLLPGLQSPLADTPAGVLTAGHLIYGLVLGWRVKFA
jgi:hypothetical protein